MVFQSLLPTFENPMLHALDEVGYELFKGLENEMQGLKTMLNPKICDSKFLPFLAYENAVDFWGDDLSNQEKRNLISSSKELKRKKGTVYAVEKVLEQFNITGKVIQWKDYKGEPYHFKIDIESIGIAYNSSELQTLEQYINTYKNVRSVLDSINVKASIDAASIYIGTGVDVSEIIELELV